MLFDLRGRGRRRTVQAIYLGLAILMGGGLVLFGIGGATSGGLLDAIQGSSGSSNAGDVFQKRVDRLEKRTKANPSDANAWAQLAVLRFQLATGQQENTARIGQVKREIARLNTILREREIAAHEALESSNG